MTSRKLRYKFPQVRRDIGTDYGWNCLLVVAAIIWLLAALLLILNGTG